MDEKRFFTKGEGLTLAELAAICGGSLSGRADPDVRIRGLASLIEADAGDLSFYDNPRYEEAMHRSAAGCIVLSPKYLDIVQDERPLIVSEDPQRAFALAGRALFPDAVSPQAVGREEGIAATAVVDPSAILEGAVTIEAGAVIGACVRIGRGTIVGCNAVVGPGCAIGRDCRIGPQTTVLHALIGNRVILHPGVRIGQDGFGYSAGREGILKMVQVGRVIIQDDVEIGANTTVDRGAIRDTVIGENTKIDNQVQIAHNVRIGRNCMLVAQVGIAGSATLGDGVAIGGQTGINGHVTIGDGAQIAAVSTVAGDVPAGARWGGVPAKPVRIWFREMRVLGEIAKASRFREK